MSENITPTNTASPAVDLTKSTECLTREQAYITKIGTECKQIIAWNTLFRAYLNSRHAPILIQLSEAHTTLTDAKNGVESLLALIDHLYRIHDAQRKFYMEDTKMYNLPLNKNTGKLPTTSESGQCDPSILALATLTQHLYNQHKDHEGICDKLKQLKKDLLPYKIDYNFKGLFAQLAICETIQTDLLSELNKYQNAVDEIVSNQNDLSQLFAKKRRNIYEAKQVYIRAIQKLYIRYQTATTSIMVQTQTYLAEDAARRAKMIEIIAQMTNDLITHHSDSTNQLQSILAQQQTQITTQSQKARHFVTQQRIANKNNPKPEKIVYIDTSDKNFIKVNPILPAPSITTSSFSKYYKTIDVSQTMASAVTTMAETTAPGLLPGDATIVKQAKAKLPGLISDTDCQLFYTASHQIVMIKNEVTQKIMDGLHSDLNKGIEKNVTKSKSASKIDEKAASSLASVSVSELAVSFGDAEFIANGAVVVASKSPKKDDTMILKETNPGLLSRNHEYKVILSSPAEVNEWIEFINSHNFAYAEISPQ